jgi:hypothetical protein
MNVIVKSILCLLFLSTYIINSISAKNVDGLSVDFEISDKDICKEPKKLTEEEKEKIDKENAKNDNDSKKEKELYEKYNNNDLEKYQDKYNDYLKNFEKAKTVNKNDKVNKNDLDKNPNIANCKFQQKSKSCCQ